MKVLIANDYNSYGGAEYVAHEQVKLLKAAGAEVGFLTFDPSLKAGKIDTGRYNIKVSEKKLVNGFNKLFFSPSIYFKFRHVLKRFNPDVVIIHCFARSPIAQYLAVEDYKSLQIVHDYFFICPKFNCMKPDGTVCHGCKSENCVVNGCRYGSSRTKLIIYALHARSIVPVRKRCVDRFVTPSEMLQKKLIEYGYDAELLSNPFKCASARKNMDRNLDFFYAGRINDDKGIFRLIEAFAIFNKGRNCKLVVAGGFSRGNFEKRFNSLLKKYDWIDYRGALRQSEVQDLMRHSRFVCVPAMGMENYPTVVLEAFASGTVPIGSDRGGVKELLSDDRGIRFNVLDKTDIADKLRMAYLMPEGIYDRMVAAGHKYLKTHNDPDEYAGKLMKMCRELTNKHR